MRIAQLLFCLGILVCFQAARIVAQGTAFTYQGRLNDCGVPASGSYDFLFRLAADPMGKIYVGNPSLTNRVPVTDGMFLATLDFGAGVFTGGSYWLEISVRTNGAGAGYTILTPLQSITPSPYAVFAGTASNVSGAITLAQLPPAVITNGASGVSLCGTFNGNGSGLTGVALLAGGNSFNGNQFFANGNVGIGTNTPASKLAVAGTVTASGFSGDGGGLTNVFSPTQSDYLFVYANSGVKTNGTFDVFKYTIGPGTNINFNSSGVLSGWVSTNLTTGRAFVAAHSGVYWVQYSVCDVYQQGGFPHFQAILNGVGIPGSQSIPIFQGSTTTSFIASIKAGDKLAIQCTTYAAEALGTWNAGYYAALTVLRIK